MGNYCLGTQYYVLNVQAAWSIMLPFTFQTWSSYLEAEWAHGGDGNDGGGGEGGNVAHRGRHHGHAALTHHAANLVLQTESSSFNYSRIFKDKFADFHDPTIFLIHD